MAELTAQEKERVRYHLGYMEVSSAPSIQLGIPKPLQTVFLLEDALTLLTNVYAVDRVRCILQTLDQIEGQLRAGTCTLVADKLGELQLHPLRAQGKLFTDSLEKEYRRWAQRLADVMGVPLYPYSQRFRASGPGAVLPVRS